LSKGATFAARTVGADPLNTGGSVSERAAFAARTVGGVAGD
jgi:hypothetical protein